MSTNAFYCPRCGKFTRHCEISMREFSALNGDGFVAQTAGVINDITGMSYLMRKFSGYNFWKCMDCGFATSRNSKGEVKNIAENS